MPRPEPNGLLGQSGKSDPTSLPRSGEPSPFDSVRDADLLEATVPRDGQPQGTESLVSGSEQRKQALDELRDDLQPQFAMHMLMLLDVTVSPEAWKNARFSELLGEFGVPIASPILVSDEISAALQDSRVFNGNDANAIVDKDAGEAKASLVFLQAKGMLVDKLINQMSGEKTNFPEVRIDLAIDPADQFLARLLKSQKNKPSNGPSAKILVTVEEAVQAAEMVPSFTPGQRRAGFVPSASRIPPAGSSNELLGAMNPVSEVLIILRKP